MVFRQYSPSKALSAYIKCYWILESEFVPGEPERILPDGCTELIFHYGDQYKRISEEGATEQPKSLLVGQIKRAIRVQPTGKTGMLGIRFYPWGLYPFTVMPVNELTEQFVEADILFKQADNLSEQLCSSLSQQEMIEYTEAFLLSIISKQHQKYFYHADKFSGIIPELLKDTSEASVSHLAITANMSERQFNRKFNEITGLSPKHFIRIARMQQFIHSYRGVRNSTSLHSLIYGCGYYDPAHFTRDFKDIAGINPSAYFEELKDLGSAMLL